MPRSAKGGANQNTKRNITSAGGFRLTANGSVLVNDPDLLKVITALDRNRASPRPAPAGS